MRRFLVFLAFGDGTPEKNPNKNGDLWDLGTAE